MIQPASSRTAQIGTECFLTVDNKTHAQPGNASTNASTFKECPSECRVGARYPSISRHIPRSVARKIIGLRGLRPGGSEIRVVIIAGLPALEGVPSMRRICSSLALLIMSCGETAKNVFLNTTIVSFHIQIRKLFFQMVDLG
jgi:hypothetical protein